MFLLVSDVWNGQYNRPDNAFGDLVEQSKPSLKIYSFFLFTVKKAQKKNEEVIIKNSL